jgi:hypothetical protein
VVRYSPAGRGDLRQHLVGQLQQDFPLRRKAQRLALTHKETKAKALFQIAELVRQGGLGLVQGRCRAASEPLFRNACSVFRCLISIMKVLHFAMSNLRLRNIQ